MKRPMVVEAYMTHASTPLITEVLKNGKTRKVGRLQLFCENGSELMLAHYRETYGDRWKGIRARRKVGTKF